MLIYNAVHLKLVRNLKWGVGNQEKIQGETTGPLSISDTWKHKGREVSYVVEGTAEQKQEGRKYTASSLKD